MFKNHSGTFPQITKTVFVSAMQKRRILIHIFQVVLIHISSILSGYCEARPLSCGTIMQRLKRRGH